MHEEGASVRWRGSGALPAFAAAFDVEVQYEVAGLLLIELLREIHRNLLWSHTISPTGFRAALLQMLINALSLAKKRGEEQPTRSMTLHTLVHTKNFTPEIQHPPETIPVQLARNAHPSGPGHPNPSSALAALMTAPALLHDAIRLHSPMTAAAHDAQHMYTLSGQLATPMTVAALHHDAVHAGSS